MSNEFEKDFVVDQQRRLLELQHQVLLTQQELIRMKGSASASSEDTQKEPDAAEHKNPEDEEKESHEEGVKKKKKPLSGKQKLLIASLAIVFIGVGIYFAYDQYTYENTDDAYVQANDTQLTPMVDGVVTHVFVVENQRVKAGQILVKINEKDYRTALDAAQANLNAVKAQFENAQDDFKRYTNLLRVGSISKQDFDHAQTSFEDYKHKVEQAQAQLDQARLNLDYTSVRAPSDGQIARKAVEVGTYAKSGSSLLGFIPGDSRWVDANFKETQLGDIVPGRPAKVTVDAIGGKTFDAVVESVAPATGSTFTLLPPDNATGNFTKVVQRVPVRLILKNLNDDDVLRLHAGLSAVVNVIKHGELQAVPKEQGVIYTTQQIHQPAPPLFGAPVSEQQASDEIIGVRSATTQEPPECLPNPRFQKQNDPSLNDQDKER